MAASAITCARTILNTYTGDFTASVNEAAVSNTNSPGTIQIVTLANGANTITPPSGGTSPQGCTIVPPTGNTTGITLKGVTGDTGVALHLTDPTSLGLGSTTATFVLTAASTTAGVRLIWS